MSKLILLPCIIINSILFSQTITRIDNSRITANELDSKISQLMRDASVTGMAVSVFNDGKPVYKKMLAIKMQQQKLRYGRVQISTAHRLVKPFLQYW